MKAIVKKPNKLMVKGMNRIGGRLKTIPLSINDIKAIPIDLVIAYNKSYGAISDEYELRDLARRLKRFGVL